MIGRCYRLSRPNRRRFPPRTLIGPLAVLPPASPAVTGALLLEDGVSYLLLEDGLSKLLLE